MGVQPIDYADSGMDVQSAMIDHFTRFPDKQSRAGHIRWNGRQIYTADPIAVPEYGSVRADFVHFARDVEQGFDLTCNGWIELPNGVRIVTLRTWVNDSLPLTVHYSYRAIDRKLWLWNVYKMRYSGNQAVEEKWTGNAGFWIEEISPLERIYHCSHGMATPPDFE